MGKTLREKGQALVEYVVLIAPLSLISVSALTVIPDTGYGFICDLDNALRGDMCQGFGPTSIPPTPQDTATPIPTAAPGETQIPSPTPTLSATPTLTQTPVPSPTLTITATATEILCVTWPDSNYKKFCNNTEGCELLPGESTGYYISDEPIETFILKSGGELYFYEEGTSEDECFTVEIVNGSVSWWNTGSCRDPRFAQVWVVPFCSD